MLRTRLLHAELVFHNVLNQMLESPLEEGCFERRFLSVGKKYYNMNTYAMLMFQKLALVIVNTVYPNPIIIAQFKNFK